MHGTTINIWYSISSCGCACYNTDNRLFLVIYHWMAGWLTNNKLESTWKEVVMVWGTIKACDWSLWINTKKKKNFSQCLVWDLTFRNSCIPVKVRSTSTQPNWHQCGANIFSDILIVISPFPVENISDLTSWGGWMLIFSCTVTN